MTTTRRSTATNLRLTNDHQQYLDKNSDGYCGIGGTGISCPVGLGA